jgi:hypothetical protein
VRGDAALGDAHGFRAGLDEERGHSMKQHLHHRGLRFLLIAAGLLVAGGSLAYAAIPDAQGVIHGCRDTSTGDLRVIDTQTRLGVTSRCSVSESPLNWNQTGPQGDTGPAGQPGISGYEHGANTVNIGPGFVITGTAACPTGKRVLGGGVINDAPIVDQRSISISQSGPLSDNIWMATVANESDEAVTFTWWAICALVGDA